MLLICSVAAVYWQCVCTIVVLVVVVGFVVAAVAGGARGAHGHCSTSLERWFSVAAAGERYIDYYTIPIAVSYV